MKGSQFKMIFASCLMAVGMFATGCGDDDSSGTDTGSTSNGTATSNGTSSSNGTSTSNGTATSNGTTGTSNGTTATSNGTTATSNGTTATSNGTTATSNGTTDPVDPCEGVECGDNEFCMNGECVADIAGPEDYPYDAPASWVNSIEIETNGDIGEDLDGDGSPDNALGNLLEQLSGLLMGVDLNGQLQEAIDEGSLAIGMTWPTLTDEADISNASDVDIHLFVLDDTDDDPTTQDSYSINPQSFIEGSGNPQIQFNGSTIENGKLSAGPAQFAFGLDLAGIPLNLLIDNALFSGDVSLDDNGVAVTGGELAGAVPLSVIVDGLNGYLNSSACNCDGQRITGSGRDFQCNPDFDLGSCEGEDTCRTIATACGVAVPVVVGQADFDLAGGDTECTANRTCDSITVFLRLGASGTDIVAAE